MEDGLVTFSNHARICRLDLGIIVLAVGVLATGCGSASSRSHSASQPARWIDQPVTFNAGGVTIHATYRHPTAQPKPVPGALLIAGSGPTDRNGNSAVDPGPVDTLRAVVDWLSADGVASLRYDKLGSGQTGLGPYAVHPDTIGIRPFQQEATAALSFLARQPAVDRSRLALIGHSEGALFALLLATGKARPAPTVHAVGLLEPPGLRYLDVIATQVQAQVSAGRRAGRITPAKAASVERGLADAIQSLRSTGRVPASVPPALATVLNPSTALFLSQADRYDPAQLVARLAPHLPVLVTCSNADIQVPCAQVDRLVAGLGRAFTNTDFIHLSGVDHVLKQDPSGSAANYTKPLAFSSQLRTALRAFVQENL